VAMAAPHANLDHNRFGDITYLLRLGRYP